MRIRFLLTNVFLFSSLVNFSQEIELDPVTVTGSILESRLIGSGRNITVVKGEQLNRLPVHSIEEMLRFLPGIETQQRGPMGSQSDIILRGGTFQQVLVLIDGVRINDPNTGHFNSYIPISPSEIDRIEILKGAASAIYGSDAVGGVIHIITKTFAATKNAGHSMDVSALAGEYGLFSLNAGGFYSHKKTAFSAGVLTNNSDGQIQRGTRGFFNNHTFSASINQQLGEKWDISLRSSYDTRSFAAQNFYTTFISDTADEKVQTQWNQVQVKFSGIRSRFLFNAGYKTVKDHFQFNPSSIPNDNRSKLAQATAVYEQGLTSSLKFTGGMQFQDRRIRSNDRGTHQLTTWAPFVLINGKVGSRFYYQPSLRVEFFENSTEVIPQLNLSYVYNRLVLRGSAGKTIRDADFTERFNNYNKSFVSGGRIGNPWLKAESSISYEFGFDFSIKKNLRISSTWFQRFHDDLIDWVNTAYANMPRKDNLSPNGSYALASNIAEVNTKGFETDLFFEKRVANGHIISSRAGFVWLESSSSNSVPSLYVSSHARLLTNFTFRYSNRYAGITVAGVYKNRMQQKAAAINAEVDKNSFIINAIADVTLLKEKLFLFVEVDNIFDRISQDVLGAPLNRRWLMAGVRLSLKK